LRRRAEGYAIPRAGVRRGSCRRESLDPAVRAAAGDVPAMGPC